MQTLLGQLMLDLQKEKQNAVKVEFLRLWELFRASSFYRKGTVSIFLFILDTYRQIVVLILHLFKTVMN